MEKMTCRLVPVLLTFPVALTSVACSGNDDVVTAENITLEECNDLFAEDDGNTSADEEDMLAGDYDADGDEDEDDETIEERCAELMAEDDTSADVE